MSDDLLQYYKQELSFIRRLAGQFAQENPRVAERLRLSPEACQDPHAERLIEAFAFLTARIRRKLDDEFPEIAEAMLGALYPHYLAPWPSMAVAQFELNRGQADLAEGYPIDAGSLLGSSPNSDGDSCCFRTCYPTTVWPIEVVRAELARLGLPPPGLPSACAAMLAIDLRCFSEEMTFAKLRMPSLRFFLHGQAPYAFALYELIFNNTLQVALARSGGDTRPVVLDSRVLHPVGFGLSEGLVPCPARSFPGYRLLSEYFAFPQKFLFVDIALPEPALLQGFGNTLQVRLYHDRSSTDLETNISGETFRLGCTPIVNLFKKKAEPIKLTHREPEYRVVPDNRGPAVFEVYSIDSVTATSPDGREVEYLPFYSVSHASDRRRAFWHASRRTALREDGAMDLGTEIFLALVDLDSPPLSGEWVLDVQTTCLNRDLLSRSPFGGGRPGFQLQAGGPVATRCLTPPTATRRPALREGILWRLVSHLVLNQLSLGDAEGRPDALREILSLYDLADTADTRGKIAGVLDIRHRRIVGRVAGVTSGGVCRGVEVALKLDPQRFSDRSAFLFSAVLERFLTLYASINSFTRLVAASEHDGEIRQWMPRVGERALL